MKFVFVIMLGTVVANAYVIKDKSVLTIMNGVYNYHRTIGIPLAEEIKKYETPITQRITGGLATEIDAVPYQAGLLITVTDSISVCGGAIVSETRILTAAHCYSDGISTADGIMVVLGSTLLFFEGTRIQTTDVVVHSGFNPRTAENDIAVIRVASVTFTSQIQPVALPSGEVNMDFTGYEAIASGFGMTSDDDEITLLQTVSTVTVPVISNAECKAVYGGFVQSQQLCTSGEEARSTCGGDSGSPLVVNLNSKSVLIGITSFGAELCTASYPSAYVRVTHFLDWITALL